MSLRLMDGILTDVAYTYESYYCFDIKSKTFLLKLISFNKKKKIIAQYFV